VDIRYARHALRSYLETILLFVRSANSITLLHWSPAFPGIWLLLTLTSQLLFLATATAPLPAASPVTIYMSISNNNSWYLFSQKLYPKKRSSWMERINPILLLKGLMWSIKQMKIKHLNPLRLKSSFHVLMTTC